MTVYPKIKSYVEDAFSSLEENHGKAFGLDYVGHKLMVPNKGDFFVLPGHQERYALLNQGENQYALVSNICTHRQSILLRGKGNIKNITCPLHCWVFGLDGKLKGAPHFKDDVKGADLSVAQLHEWQGLLFRNRVPDLNLQDYGLENYYNFEGYEYIGTESETYQFNWKVFMEIYLENYHVFSMHPGLKKYVTPSDLEWCVGKDYSIQKVGMGTDLTKANTDIYKDWQNILMKQFGGELPRYGAIWGLLYPNVMIEWYPHVLVISTVYPKGAKECVNHVEFYYPKDIYQENPEYFEKEMKAYMETALEDNDACLLLQKGREALYSKNEELYGPIDSFLEKGVGEFYDFLARS